MPVISPIFFLKVYLFERQCCIEREKQTHTHKQLRWGVGTARNLNLLFGSPSRIRVGLSQAEAGSWVSPECRDLSTWMSFAAYTHIHEQELAWRQSNQSWTGAHIGCPHRSSWPDLLGHNVSPHMCCFCVLLLKRWISTRQFPLLRIVLVSIVRCYYVGHNSVVIKDCLLQLLIWMF